MSATPMVTIFCVAYNHEPYIADALDGFMMQKTNFSVECLIVNDCSTDGTMNVVRDYQKKYPDRIRVVMPPQNTKGRFASEIYPHLHGKYIAFCEGDDYWVDTYKLQKQVDYMEEHPTCACCCCNSFFLDQNDIEESKKNKKLVGPIEDKDHLNVQAFLDNSVYKGGTAAMLYRNYHEGIPAWAYRFSFGDLIYLLQSFKHGYMHYSGEIGAIYRINVPGSYNGRINALGPEERAFKWLQYREEQCEVLQYFNIDTNYRWDEAIQKAKRNIRDNYIAKQYMILNINKAMGRNAWNGILPVIDSVMKAISAGSANQEIAIWGFGRVGRDLINELNSRGCGYKVFDQKKNEAKKPVDIFASKDKYFVIVTMMRGYEEAEKQLQEHGYVEWNDYICLAKFTDIWMHYYT